MRNPRSLLSRLIVPVVVALALPALAGPKPGEKAPVFNLKTVDKGEVRTLESLGKGKLGTAVIFLSCKCPYVVKAREPIAELVKTFGAKVQFVGLNANQNESVEDVKTDAAASFAFPMLRDEGSKIADLYAAERTPEVFFVDPSGVVRYHGGIDGLKAALVEVTAGKPVSKPESKAFGCTIKRKP